MAAIPPLCELGERLVILLLKEAQFEMDENDDDPTKAPNSTIILLRRKLEWETLTKEILQLSHFANKEPPKTYEKLSLNNLMVIFWKDRFDTEQLFPEANSPIKNELDVILIPKIVKRFPSIFPLKELDSSPIVEKSELQRIFWVML